MRPLREEQIIPHLSLFLCKNMAHAFEIYALGAVGIFWLVAGEFW